MELVDTLPGGRLEIAPDYLTEPRGNRKSSVSAEILTAVEKASEYRRRGRTISLDELRRSRSRRTGRDEGSQRSELHDGLHQSECLNARWEAQSRPRKTQYAC